MWGRNGFSIDFSQEGNLSLLRIVLTNGMLDDHTEYDMMGPVLIGLNNLSHLTKSDRIWQDSKELTDCDRNQQN